MISGGAQEGRGRYVYSHGESYDGEWKNGKMEGKGLYKYDDGNEYEGAAQYALTSR